MNRLLLVLLLSAACSQPAAPPDAGLDAACECGARVCGQLACGKICGSCPAESFCSPDGLQCVAPLAVGTACRTDLECGLGRVCLRDGTHQPGGYCSKGCSASTPCPPGASCALLRDGAERCVRTCAVDADCRTDEGYACRSGVCEPCVGTCEHRECGGDGCGGECGVVYPTVPACETPGDVCTANLCQPLFPVFHQLGRARWDVAGVTTANGEVLLVGGRERIEYAAGIEPRVQTRATALVERFNPALKTFTAVAPLPEPLARANAVLVEGALFVAGGTLDPDVPGAPDAPATHLHKLVGAAWESSPLPADAVSMSGGAVALGGRIFLLPGQVDGVASTDVWSYSPATRAWRREPSRPTARSHFAYSTDGERLWVAGGWDGEKALDTVEVWSEAGGWETSERLPVAVASARAAIVAGRMFLFSGYAGPDEGGLVPRVIEIDLRTGATRLVGTVYENWSRQAPVLTREGQLLLFGGYARAANDFDGRTDILEFRLPTEE